MRKTIARFGSYILLGLVFLMLVFLNIFYHDHWLDSDMAAEMIFSRLLAQEGHIFAAQDWYYSTEFRFLYTHLVMGPLFRLSGDWHMIRVVTNIVSYVLMVASYFYMMKPFKVQSQLTALTAVILLLPFSETMMLHMEMGNTYPWHVILCFLFLGMFLRLVQKGEYKKGRRWEITFLYVLLAIICGVSGVRYLLALQVPLVLTAFFYLLGTEEYGQFRAEFGVNRMVRAYWKRIWKCERAYYLYYALLGIVGSVAGYGINVLWISRQYIFQTYDGTNFIAVYQGVLWERAQNALGSLLMLFGYIPDRSVLSLRGIITMIAFVLIAVFVYCGVRVYRGSEGLRFFLVLFLGVAFALNEFVFVFTTSTMVPRYYLTIFIFVLPVLAFFLEQGEPVWDKLVVGVILVVSLGMSTGKTVLSFITTDKNADKRSVVAFLEEQYDFGYATYWNANIVTELTNGQVEVANILDPDKLQFFTWSTPQKYYEENYHTDEVFLLLTEAEATEYAEAEVLQIGDKVYDDGNYVVYEYENVETLMSGRRSGGQEQVR